MTQKANLPTFPPHSL